MKYIFVYRNGFKVPPYGDGNDDWLNISKLNRIGQGVPFSNAHLLGLVQISDSKSIIFEEVAGREGIIEKEAYRSMQSFVSLALKDSFLDFVSYFKKTEEFKIANKQSKKEVTSKTVKDTLDKISKASEVLVNKDISAEQKDKAQKTINKDKSIY